jgi:hypothetical protein
LIASHKKKALNPMPRRIENSRRLCLFEGI